MQEELERNRADSLTLCNRLLNALDQNRDDAHSFFAGEVLRAYDTATQKATNKMQKIKSKIRNL